MEYWKRVARSTDGSIVYCFMEMIVHMCRTSWKLNINRHNYQYQQSLIPLLMKLLYSLFVIMFYVLRFEVRLRIKTVKSGIVIENISGWISSLEEMKELLVDIGDDGLFGY